MALICPICEAKVPAENINIQQMVAVCPACDTVFRFDPPEAKAKRRKVKQPDHLMLREADTLRMTFRTNFRLDKNENFWGSSIMSVVFTFVTLLLINESLVDDVPLILPLAFGLVALFCYYWLALVAFNATHIEMDSDHITVSRKPLPNLFDQTRQINVDEVIAIRCQETAESKKEAYDTPRYRVSAQTTGGSRQTIVNNVTEEYAFFIAQCLSERLNQTDDLDIAHLADGELASEAGHNGRPTVPQSQENSLN